MQSEAVKVWEEGPYLFYKNVFQLSSDTFFYKITVVDKNRSLNVGSITYYDGEGFITLSVDRKHSNLIPVLAGYSSFNTLD